MKYKIISYPLIEPVTIEEAKEHLRVVGNNDDKYIEKLIWTARLYIENYLCRALITQTLELYLDNFDDIDCWDDDNTLILPRPPLQSVSSVKYYDINNVLQTFTDYDVDINAEPGRVKFKSIPAYKTDKANAIIVQYKAGFGDKATDVPYDIKQGLLITVGELYERREQGIVGAPIQPVILNAEYLLSSQRVIY